MHRVLCSTGALIGKANNQDFTILNDCHGKIACDGYEFLMYDRWYNSLEGIRSIVKRFPAPFPIFHVDKRIGERISRNHTGDIEKALSDFDCNCSLASAIGAEKLVIHLWGGLDSDRDMANNIACYKDLRQISDSYGLILTVENVVCNHSDPLSHMLSLIHVFPDIQFTFDTKMAAFHNQLEQLFTDYYQILFPHISHLHINDYQGGFKDWMNLKTLHLGQGHINFDAWFKQLRIANYYGDFTVEATSFDKNGDINFENLNASLNRTRDYLW